MEGNSSTDWGGWGWGGDGFRMIQAHYIYFILYFYYHYISPTSDHQALVSKVWGLWCVCVHTQIYAQIYEINIWNILHKYMKESESESCSVVSGSVTPWTVVHGILQARILGWVAFPFSRGSSQPRDQTQVSHIADRFFTSWATREALWMPGRPGKHKYIYQTKYSVYILPKHKYILLRAYISMKISIPWDITLIFLLINVSKVTRCTSIFQYWFRYSIFRCISIFQFSTLNKKKLIFMPILSLHFLKYEENNHDEYYGYDSWN